MSEENQVVQPDRDTTTTMVQPEKDTALQDYKHADTAEERVALMAKWGMLDDKPQMKPKQQDRSQSEVNTETTPATVGETPEGEQPPHRKPEQPKPYTAEEVKATEFDKLDYKRLPPDLVPFYNSMRASQTKSAQEIAEQRKFIKELAAELQAKPAPAPQQPRFDPAQRFVQRHEALKNAVATAFNLKTADLGDDMQHWPPAVKLAYDDFNQYVRSVESRRETERQESARQQKQMESFTAGIERELRAVDNEAYEYAMDKINKKEVLEKDKEGIVQALSSGDKKTVSQFFDKFRREFRGSTKESKESKETKKAPEPPNLETGGQGRNSPVKPGPKISEYRSADQAKRVELMRAWGMLE